MWIKNAKNASIILDVDSLLLVPIHLKKEVTFITFAQAQLKLKYT